MAIIGEARRSQYDFIEQKQARDHEKEILSQYQAAMVDLCRELGLDPSVSVADPYYYADMALEAIGNLKARPTAADLVVSACNRLSTELGVPFVGEHDPAEWDDPVGALSGHIDSAMRSMADELEKAQGDIDRLEKSQSLLDPKGRAVLCSIGSDALVFTSTEAYEPFVVAHGYDPATGEWGHGTYHSDLSRAWDEIQPGIIEDATVKWTRKDIARAIIANGIPATDRSIDAVLADVQNMRGWAEASIARGNDLIEDAAIDAANRLKTRHEENMPAERTLSCADEKALMSSLGLEPEPKQAHTVAGEAATARQRAKERNAGKEAAQSIKGVSR